MASKSNGASRSGDILIVIHDFSARTGDELNLRRGERIELIERDDEFGDGWFLGKHIKSGETGLFPEVYTTPAARLAPRTPISVLANASAGYTPPHSGNDLNREKSREESTPPPYADYADENPPLLTTNNNQSQNAFSRHSQGSSGSGRSVSLGAMSQNGNNQVMNETLSVIEEHITDMHTPRQSFLHTKYNNHEDYTPPSNRRLSYINGHETDEEDIAEFSEKEVRNWSPSQVAEHLEQLGADRQHCEVFREQEISGDLLLEMDKETIMLKEFELGTLGRRLALFKKIQLFQEEVKGPVQKTSGRTSSMTNRSPSGGTVLPKIPSLHEPSNYNGNRQRAQSASTHDMGASESRLTHLSRPSATSVHSVPNSRRHSSMDVTAKPATPNHIPITIQPIGAHGKSNSFDRTWTMGSQTTAVADSHPSTASGPSISPKVESSFLAPPQSPDYDNSKSAVDLDRGYFSSNETESRRFRNVLRKRDSDSHTRAPSDGHSALRLSGVFRHSRSGSTDSVHETSRQSLLTSMKRLSGVRPSSKIIDDAQSIDAIANSPTTIDSPMDHFDQTPSPTIQPKRKSTRSRILGLRAISDAVTGQEKAVAKDELTSPINKDIIASPSRTDSSNQSIVSTGKSVSIEEKKIKATKYNPFPTVDKQAKRKHKHETSAYLRGLEKKCPSEQIAGSDYSGWMKKKSRKLGKWHSRLFVLRGCRLSYYYTEDDTEEKGLIDIAFHRVLPANKDLLTGFHATLTGAGSSPVSPQNASIQTAAAVDIDNDAIGGNPITESGIFIFKLVPPRQGMAKAVSFTEPKVHFFAVGSVQEGRKWMAALMKATIERDERKLVSSTYKEKTMSLSRARDMRVRPMEFLATPGEEEERAEGDTPSIKAVAEEDEDLVKDATVGASKDVVQSTTETKDVHGDGWSLVTSSVDGETMEVTPVQ